MVKLTVSYDGNRTVYELTDGLHLIGRQEDCDIRVPINTVSRHHSEIRVSGSRVAIRDSGSMAGTELDGRDVGADFMEWKAGRRVHLGDVALELGDGAGRESWESGTGDEIISTPIYDLRSGMSRHARGRISKMLTRLLEIMVLKGRPAEVGRAACRMVGGMIQADHVYIEIRRQPGRPLTALAGWPRMPDSAADTPRGEHIRELVMNDRRSLLIPTVAGDERFNGVESCHGLTTVMAVPLFDGRRVLGILYADSIDSVQRYTNDDLQVLTVAGCAVALRLRDILLHDELKTARSIQRSMLPQQLPEIPGYEIDARLETCEAVGGDFYHCMQRPDGQLMLALGDISGKGMPAALAMGASTVLFRSLSELGLEIEQFAHHLDAQLYASLAGEQYLTLLLAQLDPRTGRVRYVGAAHEACVIQPDGTVKALASTGFPMGILEEMQWEVAELTLEPGELLAISSDGVDEATADGDAFFGKERYLEMLVEKRALPLAEIRQHVFETVFDFVGPDGASDDTTLLLIRRNST